MVSYDKAVYTEPKVSMKVLPCHRRMAPFFSKLVQSTRQDLLFHLQHGPPSLRLPPLPASICTALGLGQESAVQPQVPVNTPISSHGDLHSTRQSWAGKKSRRGCDQGQLQGRKAPGRPVPGVRESSLRPSPVSPYRRAAAARGFRLTHSQGREPLLSSPRAPHPAPALIRHKAFVCSPAHTFWGLISTLFL